MADCTAAWRCRLSAVKKLKPPRTSSTTSDNSRPIANRDRGQRVPASVTAMTQARIRARVPIPLLAATTFNKAVALESFRNRILDAVEVALIDLFGNLTVNRQIGRAAGRESVCQSV